MKKLFLPFILVTALSFAQEKSNDSIKQKDVKFRSYFAIGVNVNDDLNINKKLSASNLPELNNVLPELIFGFNIFGKKYSGDIEFGFLYAKPDKGENELQYLSFNSRLRAHYNVVNKEKFAFTTGVTLAYIANEYDVYSKNNTIDLNNLEPNNNSGHVNFRNQMLYLGPSASAYFFRKSSFPVRLNVGYEFAITRGRYKSDFGSILNNIGEAGNNRFVFGISLL